MYWVYECVHFVFAGSIPVLTWLLTKTIYFLLSLSLCEYCVALFDAFIACENKTKCKCLPNWIDFLVWVKNIIWLNYNKWAFFVPLVYFYWDVGVMLLFTSFSSSTITISFKSIYTYIFYFISCALFSPVVLLASSSSSFSLQFFSSEKLGSFMNCSFFSVGYSVIW